MMKAQHRKPKPALKKPVRRVRRNPYARALEQATKRHEKALREQALYNSKLIALNSEIPRLQEMIRTLDGYVNKTPVDSANRLANMERHNAEVLAALNNPNVRFDGGTSLPDGIITGVVNDDPDDAFLDDNAIISGVPIGR